MDVLSPEDKKLVALEFELVPYEMELKTILEDRQLILDRLIKVAGPCPKCGNDHYPHCGKSLLAIQSITKCGGE